jgi:hypothetical protein
MVSRFENLTERNDNWSCHLGYLRRFILRRISQSRANPPTNVVVESLVTDIEAATYWLGWIHAAKVTGAFFVAIGVAAEFLGDWVAKPYEDVIEAGRRADVSRLSQETLRLSTEAETARLSLAQAENHPGGGGAIA